jgi:hypothetical protein
MQIFVRAEAEYFFFGGNDWYNLLPHVYTTNEKTRQNQETEASAPITGIDTCPLFTIICTDGFLKTNGMAVCWKKASKIQFLAFLIFDFLC